LVLIGEIDLLPRLFATVFVPEIVRDELSHAHTPPSIREWIASRPAWVLFVSGAEVAELPLPTLDDGERSAIALALTLRADLILIDDRRGVAAALALGFDAVGTIGLLDRAARQGHIDLGAALMRLKSTNFRYRPEMLDALLAPDRR
jgi:predicted nucleic acid-binding protein